LKNRKTNLFIVGAMKAGTTSFMEILSEHNDIYVSPIKEPHFFINGLPDNLYKPSRFFSLENYFKQEFPKPLHITKVETFQQYQHLFSLAGDQKFIAEGSTAYLHAKESAALIHNYNPNSKIIIMVRDPIKRAFSHYRMNLGLGIENRAFESVLVQEIDLYNQEQLPWNSYLGMSIYRGALRRYKALFDKVLILHFEDFITNRISVLKTVAQFLGTTPFTSVETAHINESKTLRFQKLFYLLKQLGLKDYFTKIFSSKFKQWIFRKLIKKNKQELILNPETTSKLEVIFNN
jgi:Sulfotransferase family